MLADSDFRNVTELTLSDFVDFEMQVEGVWRKFRISGAALSLLKADIKLARLPTFERNIGRIKDVARNLGITNEGTGRVAIISKNI
jgi:hypothetical protein